MSGSPIREPVCPDVSEGVMEHLQTLISYKEYQQAVDFLHVISTSEAAILYSYLLRELLNTWDESAIDTVNANRRNAVVTLLTSPHFQTAPFPIMYGFFLLAEFSYPSGKNKSEIILNTEGIDRDLFQRRLITAMEQKLKVRLDGCLAAMGRLSDSNPMIRHVWTEFVEALLAFERFLHNKVLPVNCHPNSEEMVPSTAFSTAVQFGLLDEAVLLYKTGCVTHRELAEAAQNKEVLYATRTFQTNEDEDEKKFLESILKNPRTLFSCARLSLSQCLGPDPGREQRAQFLELPRPIVGEVLLETQILIQNYLKKKKLRMTKGKYETGKPV